MSEEYALQMKSISKSFPGVKALDHVNLMLKKKSVHALVGENGAGKSTLMKILTGMYTPDEGEIIVKGKSVTISNAKESLGYGISMIYQELNPVPEMTVRENLFLGRELTKGPMLDIRRMREESKKMLASCNVDLDPNTKMKYLSVAQQQLVEIVKAVFHNSDIIVMDEPTSAITEDEVTHLFEIIRKLIDDGKSIIFITHRLDEIFEICDTMTILRDGQYIDSRPIEGMVKQDIISMMVGRELTNNIYTKYNTKIGEVTLEVKNLTSADGRFKDISFQARQGEILGVAGLMGAGRSEVMETIFGIRKASGGEVFVHGRKVQIKSAQDAIKNKIAFITEDRKVLGLNLLGSVKDNIALVNLPRYCSGAVINHSKVRQVVDRQIEALNIKTPSRDQIVNNLSGGNQQKVVLAKWLLCEPDILILDEPTRGIDVGAKAEIYKLISAMAQEGKTVIMISSELPEVIGMSDRIIVLFEGKLTGELNVRDNEGAEVSQDNIMSLASGEQIAEA